MIFEGERCLKEDKELNVLRYSICMDLCDDYSGMIKYWLSKRGTQTKSSGMDLWYEFLNLRKNSKSTKTQGALFSKVKRNFLGSRSGWLINLMDLSKSRKLLEMFAK